MNERWWHVFDGTGGDGVWFAGCYAALVVKDTDEHPEALMVRTGGTVDMAGSTLAYARSFDHEPSDDEMETIHDAWLAEEKST